jgi:hypothetical protein
LYFKNYAKLFIKMGAILPRGESKMSERTEQHIVRITKSLGQEWRKEIVAFIGDHLAEYKGKTEDKTEGKHGIPLMVFDKQSDAHVFANEMSEKLNFPREHIDVKPRGDHLKLNRPDVIRKGTSAPEPPKSARS